MPAWQEYKATAQSRGALALELYVAESMPAGSMDAVKDTLPDHLAYQKDMEKAGKLAFAGPLSDDTGEEMTGAGLIVYRAANLDEARAIAEADPMHKTGARTFRLRRWLINEGSFSLGVALSDQSVRFT